MRNVLYKNNRLIIRYLFVVIKQFNKLVNTKFKNVNFIIILFVRMFMNKYGK